MLRYILLFIPFLSFSQGVVRIATATSADAYEVTFNPIINTLNTNTIYIITFTNSNTSSIITLDPNGAVEATSIKDNTGNNIPIGGIKAGGVYTLKYTGSEFRILEAFTTDTPQNTSETMAVKTTNYTAGAIDTLSGPKIFSIRSASDLTFTVPAYANVNFDMGTSFDIYNDSTSNITIDKEPGVEFKTTAVAPYILPPNANARVTKYNATNYWKLVMSNDTTVAAPIEVPFVIVDNATRGTQGYQWDYVSTWATPGTGVEGWYSETLDYTGTTNAYAEITFNGTRVQLYTEKKSTHGIFEVSLDGVVVDTVDLYSASPLLQELVFDSGDGDDPESEEDLTQDIHTLKIRCTGTKNGSSSAYYLLVDYVKIYNPEEVPDEELPTPPSAATHFVKTTGSNGGSNNCETEGSPCLTIAYALTQMASGEILSVGPGTFTETAYLTPGAGISIIGSGVDVTTVKVTSGLNWNVDLGAVAATKCIFQYNTSSSTAASLTDLTIDGNSKLVHGGIYISGGRNNLTVEDVKISNFDYFGAYVGADDITFRNVQIINSAEAGSSFSTGNLMISTSTDFICDNVDISDNLEGYGVKAWGAGAIIDGHIFKNSEIRVVVNSPYGGGGIPNIAYELHNCKPRNCIFENNYVDNCVSFVRPTGFADDAIPTVHIRNNTFDMITKGGGNAINTPIENGCHNMEVSANHFVGGKYAFIVHWNASESGAAVNLQVHHNTFYVVGSVNSPTGICRSSYAPFTGLYFYNNTIHIPPGSNYHTTLVFTGCCGAGRNSTNVQVKNNVIYDQSTADTGVGGANALTRLEGSGGSWASSNFTYNTVVGMSTTLPSGWTASNTLTTGPTFTGGGGVNATPFVYDPFYRPAAGSPLITSGTNVGLPYTGAAPTRGRLEQ